MRRVLTGIALLFVVSAGALAARNIPIVKLEYRPTDEGMVRAVIDPDCRGKAIAIVIEDGREASDARKIGVRSDDDDKVYDLRSENDLLPFLREAVPAIVKEWGVVSDDGAQTVLTLRIVSYSVNEQNQPVGAMYRAVVGFDAELGRAGEDPSWTESLDGDETRYGRKFSSDNANEVLSDALKKTLAQLFSNREFRDAWSGRAVPASPAVEPRIAIAPPELLVEVEKLLAAGVDRAVITGFVERHRPTPPLSADDIIAWKAAGVPDDVVLLAIASDRES